MTKAFLLQAAKFEKVLANPLRPPAFPFH